MSESSSFIGERRDAERDRRINRARVEVRPTAQALISEAGRTGNGGPPMLSALAEVEAIGQLLYGRRWTQEIAEDLGEDPRQVRRWRSGEAAVPDRALKWLRKTARDRAQQILALVGPVEV